MAIFKSHNAFLWFLLECLLWMFARMLAVYIDIEMPLEFTPQSFESILCDLKMVHQGHVTKEIFV